MVGLGASGKTTALYKLKLGEISTIVIIATTGEEATTTSPKEEAIVRIVQDHRPGLLVRLNKFKLPTDGMWKEKLESKCSLIENVIPAVGAILQNGNLLGTCWLISEDIVITNRHVANRFSEFDTLGHIFIKKGEHIQVDWNLEHNRNSPAKLTDVTNILHCESETGPDVAILKLGTPPSISPIKMNRDPPHAGDHLVTIGFPTQPNHEPHGVVLRVFGSILGVKYVCPGMMICINEEVLFHDCSTLRGSSGSVVVDLETGKAVGLHSGGKYEESNEAVPAHTLVQILEKENINYF